MPLNTHYLKELSNLFVEDLKRSDYYRKLPENESAILTFDSPREGFAGVVSPRFPAPMKQNWRNCRKRSMKSSVFVCLRSWPRSSAKSMASLRMEFTLRSRWKVARRPVRFRPWSRGEESLNWSGFPETIQKYLFVGDSDLWHFAVELATGIAVALHKSTLKQAHRFSSVEDLVE